MNLIWGNRVAANVIHQSGVVSTTKFGCSLSHTLPASCLGCTVCYWSTIWHFPTCIAVYPLPLSSTIKLFQLCIRLEAFPPLIVFCWLSAICHCFHGNMDLSLVAPRHDSARRQCKTSYTNTYCLARRICSQCCFMLISQVLSAWSIIDCSFANTGSLERSTCVHFPGDCHLCAAAYGNYWAVVDKHRIRNQRPPAWIFFSGIRFVPYRKQWRPTKHNCCCSYNSCHVRRLSYLSIAFYPV